MPPENAVRFRVDPQMRRRLDRLRTRESRQRLGLGAPPGPERPSTTSSPTRSPTTRPGPRARQPRRPSPSTRGSPTRTNRRSLGGRPASSTRAGALYSKARRWPTFPRATSCPARPSSSPTDGAIPGPRPSPTSSAEAPPRSWSPIPAGRAGKTGRYLDRGRQGLPAGHNGPLSRSGPGGSPAGPERQRRSRGAA